MDDSKKRPGKCVHPNHSEATFNQEKEISLSTNARPGVLSLVGELDNCLIKLEGQKDPLLKNEKEQNENGDASSRCIARENLRHFFHKTMEIHENERRLLAREIHDGLGGSLAAIKFLLEDILSNNGDNTKIAEPLHQTVQYIKDAIKKIRHISAGLRPSMLDDLGLGATIRWCCNNLKKSFPDITLISAININESMLHDPQKILIYRIIQEAMTNAAKHGGGDTIRLSLTQSNERLELEITDNGCGFDTSRILSGKYRDENGYGLSGIKAKTEICGGLFYIRSHADIGTALRVALPLTGC